MPINLISVDIVVIGRFNPHIITPQWLMEQEVCQQSGGGIEFQIRIDGISRQGVFQFEIEGLRWQVTDARMQITSKGFNADASATVASVLEKLPHTPVSAVGHNFHYRCDRTDWKGSVPHLGEFGFDSLGAHGEPQGVTWTAKLQQSDGLVAGLKFEQNSNAIEIHTNCHRNVENCKDAGMVTRQHFQADFNLSRNLIQTLAGDEVHHES